MKTYRVQCERRGRVSLFEGTLPELNLIFKYTLDCGASWGHEKGRKKINRNPKTLASLITNLNNAKNNSASNGYSPEYYSRAD
jgi:hypothetical protein